MIHDRLNTSKLGMITSTALLESKLQLAAIQIGLLIVNAEQDSFK